MQSSYYVKSVASIILWMLVGYSASAQNIRINEIMSSNATVLTDENGDYPDWIELYNADTIAVNLEDFGLSDDAEEPFRWIFPDRTLQPNSYLIVFASSKNRFGNQLHTNFNISADGETLLLSTPENLIADSVVCPALQTDISYGRLMADPETWKFFTPATPGVANAGEGYGLLLPAVSSSRSSGYYPEGFRLALNTPLAEAHIFYTTDGSIPNTNSALYADSIAINSRVGEANGISMIRTNNNTDTGPPYYEGWQPPLGEVYKIYVLRARLLHPDAPPGPVTTFNYFIDPLENGRYSLPVFSLATSPENLFDDEIGIYVYGNYENYFQSGMEWERAANLSFFETTGNLEFSEDVGIRTHGNTTRSRPRKSLRISTRSEYGNSWLNYQLFPEKNIHQYKRFILRNSGNDWDQAIFRDGLLQSLMRNLNVERQYYRPSILFINGEYWGIHNLRDRYDEHYLFAKYGINEQEMTIMENHSSYKFGSNAGVSHYTSMLSYVNGHNLTNDDYLQVLATKMDLESFTDMQIAHIFVMNTDWPGNNTLYWRYNRSGYDPQALNGRDGRWRWMLLDMDFGFGLDFSYVPGIGSGAAHNTLAFALEADGPGWPNPSWSTFLLRNLVKNESYRNQFINRFCDLLNTDFKSSEVVAAIDSIQNLLQPEMAEHIRRWRRPTTLTEWNNRVLSMRNFAQVRPTYLWQHLKNQFNLQATAQLTLSNDHPEMGKIKLNSMVLPQQPYWVGQYFTGIPLQLKAEPLPGYRFVRWEGQISSVSETATLSLSGDAQVRAVFEINTDFQGDSLNPVAWRLSNGAYQFTYWDANNPEKTYPPHIIFQQSETNDPALDDAMTRPYAVSPNEIHNDDAASVGFPYRLTRRTRLNGLGQDGISFINTGRGRDLGAVVMAVDTRGLNNITVAWKAGTVIPNSRAYAIRLQYRIGTEGPFTDLNHADNSAMEYMRNSEAGHSSSFEAFVLPEAFENQAYVQLRWKYYFTGEQLDPNSGSRDMLRLDDIVVSTLTMALPETYLAPSLDAIQIYPNPFNYEAVIEVQLTKRTGLTIEIHNLMGTKVQQIVENVFDAGQHTFRVDGTQLPQGEYVCMIKSDETTVARKLVLVN